MLFNHIPSHYPNTSLICSLYPNIPTYWTSRFFFFNVWSPTWVAQLLWVWCLHWTVIKVPSVTSMIKESQFSFAKQQSNADSSSARGRTLCLSFSHHTGILSVLNVFMSFIFFYTWTVVSSYVQYSIVSKKLCFLRYFQLPPSLTIFPMPSLLNIFEPLGEVHDKDNPFGAQHCRVPYFLHDDWLWYLC